MNLTFDAAREGGFIFPGARGWINTRDTAHMQELAQDAALITTPNSGVPAEFLAYIGGELTLTAYIKGESVKKAATAQQIRETSRRSSSTITAPAPPLPEAGPVPAPVP